MGGFQHIRKLLVTLIVVTILGVAASGCTGNNESKSTSETETIFYSDEISLWPDEMKNMTFVALEPGVLTVKYDFEAPENNPTILSIAIVQNGDYLNAKVIQAENGEHVKGALSANVTAGEVQVTLLNGANADPNPITYHIEVTYKKLG